MYPLTKGRVAGWERVNEPQSRAGPCAPFSAVPIERKRSQSTPKGSARAADHGTARSPSQSRQQPQNGGANSRPWRCCRGTDLWRGRASHLDRGLCAGSASSGAGAARRHSIRLARHKQTGQFSQQSLGTMTRHARRLEASLKLLSNCCVVQHVALCNGVVAPRDHLLSGSSRRTQSLVKRHARRA